MSEDPLPEKFGRFKVLDQLGRGAMGIVYRAQDEMLMRTVAIKTVALTGSSKERDGHEARFLQEARAAGALNHPAIITIYDMGREGDTAFIAMELVEGKDLRELIADVSLTPSRAVTIAASVAEGLAFAHERGIVHRDIKPGNIMVLADGRVKIMDFGIARLTEPAVKTQTGVLLGSPQYMAPEQIIGQPLDHRADIFSLGLVLYEMLTGTRAFQGDDIPELTFKVANLPAAPPTHLAPDLPPVIDFIVARALKKRPDERYSNAMELARDLQAALKDVRAAEAAGAERAAAQTVPTPPDIAPDEGGDGSGMIREEPIELRPSARFDSVEGLARLAVLPSDEHSRSRGGWTVPIKAEPRRVDRARVVVVLAYAFAFIAAVAIVVFG
ncbi:MAG TPA: serine/threonine-protein kinase [Usitatibacter sp.]|nr:serine/threonine-protein kinase [Usitatibacter sp.]